MVITYLHHEHVRFLPFAIKRQIGMCLMGKPKHEVPTYPPHFEAIICALINICVLVAIRRCRVVNESGNTTVYHVSQSTQFVPIS